MKSILLLHKDISLLAALQVLLDDNRYKVYTVTDDSQAELHLRHHQPDIIVSNTKDFEGNSRLEFLKAARNMVPSARIILVGDARVMSLFQSAVDRILELPVDVEVIFGAITEELGERSAAVGG